MSRTSERIVVVDVGNTSTSVGVFSQNRVTKRRHMASGSSAAEIRVALKRLGDPKSFAGAAMSSVSIALTGRWKSALRKATGTAPMMVSSKHELGVKLSYPRADTIGADRLADIAGGSARHGAPLIVVDMGTATTFNVIMPRKGFVGGIIAPGPNLFTDYFPDRTPALPRIAASAVRNPIGKGTVESMNLGVRHGYAGMVDGILGHILSQRGKKGARVCITGGHGKPLLQKLKHEHVYEPDLTLFGIGVIWRLNV